MWPSHPTPSLSALFLGLSTIGESEIRRFEPPIEQADFVAGVEKRAQASFEPPGAQVSGKDQNDACWTRERLEEKGVSISANLALGDGRPHRRPDT